jgi:hypothetical protein
MNKVTTFFNKLHDSASMLNRAMKNDATLKDEMKDFIREESLKTGIRVGKLYVAALNDLDKIVNTIKLVKTSAETIVKVFKEHEQDMNSYKDSNITRAIKSIVTEMESETTMHLNNRITEAMLKEKEAEVTQRLIDLTGYNLAKINQITDALEQQVNQLEAQAREHAYFDYTHLEELRFKLSCSQKLYTHAKNNMFNRIRANNESLFNKSVDSI